MTNRFRIWDGKKMLGPFTLDDIIPAVGNEVMQYTGIDDSEGTPICEADIVRFWPNDHGWYHDPESYNRIAVIRYLDGHWWMDFTDPGKGVLSDISYKDHRAEVIGNRHEDPDLLRAEA
jgi:uncharacterized phage protein (TIGR01671 family)